MKKKLLAHGGGLAIYGREVRGGVRLEWNCGERRGTYGVYPSWEVARAVTNNIAAQRPQEKE